MSIPEPSKVSNCFFVSPSAPFDVIASASVTETGETRRFSFPFSSNVFSSSLRAKFICAAEYFASAALPSTLTGVIPRERSAACTLFAQPEMLIPITAASSSAKIPVIFFFIFDSLSWLIILRLFIFRSAISLQYAIFALSAAGRKALSHFPNRIL